MHNHPPLLAPRECATRFALQVVAALVLVSLLAFSRGGWAQPSLPEPGEGGQIKALFLYNFANFVRWPEKAFAASPDRLRMCLFGHAELGSFLDQVNGTRIRDKRLQVIRADTLKDIEQGCHILFVSTDKQQYLPVLFDSIQHIYVLSVSDVEDFARQGGVISILRTSDKLSFEINLDTALRNGLLISSDLLTMARIVGRDGKPVQDRELGPEDSLVRNPG